MRSIAANVANAVRTFNLREGMERSDEQLPIRFHEEPLMTGNIIRTDEMQKLLKDYYRSRGWSDEGNPVVEKQ